MGSGLFAAEIAKKVDGFSPTATCAEVLGAFERDPDLLLAPVLDDRLPVGLITRRHLHSQLSAQFGREVWLNRPIARIMIVEPTLIRIDTPLEQIAAMVASLPQDTVYNGVIFVDEQGEYRGVASGFDLFKANVRVTESKNAELKSLTSLLRGERDKATAASSAKSDFLATMSHEIRTPLNGVLGMAQALALEELSQAQREKLEVIITSGETLTALLNDILDLSKIEAGKLELSPTSGDLTKTIHRVAELFRSRASEKNIDLVLELPDEESLVLRYDHVRVHQCIANLVSNAVKFTAEGAVTIALKITSRTSDQPRIQISVEDTGIGMSLETLDRLFESFTQADGAITRTFGGSGLGLSITRRLSRMMGGDVTVESKLGVGSKFIIQFDAEACASQGGGSVSSALPPGPAVDATVLAPRVLLVDDNAVNRQVVRLFLAPLAPQIDEAVNGQEALDQLAAATEPYDVVLMDIHMPVMDGREAVRRIRSSNSSWSRTPVIALTADAMEGDRDNLLALGMDDYVAKPVDRRLLISRIAAVVTSQASKNSAVPAEIVPLAANAGQYR